MKDTNVIRSCSCGHDEDYNCSFCEETWLDIIDELEIMEMIQ